MLRKHTKNLCRVIYIAKKSFGYTQFSKQSRALNQPQCWRQPLYPAHCQYHGLPRLPPPPLSTFSIWTYLSSRSLVCLGHCRDVKIVPTARIRNPLAHAIAPKARPWLSRVHPPNAPPLLVRTSLDPY